MVWTLAIDTLARCEESIGRGFRNDRDFVGRRGATGQFDPVPSAASGLCLWGTRSRPLISFRPIINSPVHRTSHISLLSSLLIPTPSSFPRLSPLHLSSPGMTSLAPRALTALSRPTLLAPTILNARGHAAAVDPPSGSSRRYLDGDVRHDWRRSEIQRIFDAPLMETIYRAVSRAGLLFVRCWSEVAWGLVPCDCRAALMPTVQATVHRMHQDASRIQLCTLMNIKSGSAGLTPLLQTLQHLHGLSFASLSLLLCCSSHRHTVHSQSSPYHCTESYSIRSSRRVHRRLQVLLPVLVLQNPDQGLPPRRH